MFVNVAEIKHGIDRFRMSLWFLHTERIVTHGRAATEQTNQTLTLVTLGFFMHSHFDSCSFATRPE